MKKLLTWVLILMLCTGALAEAVPGNRLGLELLAKLYDGTENQFVSPVSLAYALSMAAMGANGATLEEILTALDATDAADITALNDALAASGLRWANAAFVQPNTELLPSYEAALAEFEADSFPLDDAERVNSWASEHTDGMIDHLLDEVSPELQMLLVNAIVMDQQWASPFDPNRTWEDVFYAPDGERTVQFMRQTLERADYCEAEGTQALRMDCADSDLYALLALPPEGGVEDALARLAEEGLAWFDFESGQPRKVALTLPRLDVSVSNSLSDALRELGVREAFSGGADFSGISASPLMISDVLQKVRVEITEQGAKAAAVTEIMVALGAAPNAQEPEIVVMRLDRPFIIVIADAATGAICFAGVVAKP